VGGDRGHERGGSFGVPVGDESGPVGASPDAIPPVVDELPQLMARLGWLLERLRPDMVVMSREEFQHRELKAYSSGWQDAVEECAPRVAAARWEGWFGRWRPRRSLEGPGHVIPFPVARRTDRAVRDRDGAGTTGGREAADGRDPRGGAAPERGSRLKGERGRTGGDPPVPGGAQRSGARSDKPSLTPKSRRSKSPTIPRLAPLPPLGPRSGADAPRDTPD
jgi:hypothetical protein